MFSFGGSSPKPATNKVSASTVDETATGMSKAFQSTVSKLLKGDRAKINTFQKATDSFRSGSTSVATYLASLDSLFGEEALVTVIKPLVSGLPEKEAAKQLQTAYDKKLKDDAKKKKAEAAEELKKKKAAAAEELKMKKAAAAEELKKKKAAAAALKKSKSTKTSKNDNNSVSSSGSAKSTSSSSTTKSSGSSSGPTAGLGGFFSFGAKPKASAPSATPLAMPSKVPASKRKSVEPLLVALNSPSGDAQVFYTALVKALGKVKAKAVIPDIVAQLPKDKATKLKAIDAASK
mmetsp:Transcript_17492/g.29316  ORF Transcript_17492/g.29316 Transcript_17492/m.29316 type:complete len:291 (+) Transcript_17492:1-873(+)